VRQFAVEQQVGGFQVVGLLGELFDRITAVQQDALVAINISDFRLTRGGRHKTWVKGETTRGGQATDVNYIRAYGASKNGQFYGGSALEDQLRFFVSHEWPPSSAWNHQTAPHQRSAKHTSELQSRAKLVCRLRLERI